MNELEKYFRTNLYSRDFYLDLSCYPLCIGCPYYEIEYGIFCLYECQFVEQAENALSRGY